MTQRFVRPSAQPGAAALTSPTWPLPKRAALASLLAALWMSPLCVSAQTPPPAEAASAPLQNSALDAPMFYQLLIGELEAEVGYVSDLAAAARGRFAEALERFGPDTGELTVTRIAETAAATSIRSR